MPSVVSAPVAIQGIRLAVARMEMAVLGAVLLVAPALVVAGLVAAASAVVGSAAAASAVAGSADFSWVMAVLMFP
jgi:hypothetical protein